MVSLSELLEREEQLQLLIERVKSEKNEFSPKLDSMHQLEVKHREAIHDLAEVEKKIIKKLLKELKRRTVE